MSVHLSDIGCLHRFNWDWDCSASRPGGWITMMWYTRGCIVCVGPHEPVVSVVSTHFKENQTTLREPDWWSCHNDKSPDMCVCFTSAALSQRPVQPVFAFVFKMLRPMDTKTNYRCTRTQVDMKAGNMAPEWQVTAERLEFEFDLKRTAAVCSEQDDSINVAGLPVCCYHPHALVQVNT